MHTREVREALLAALLRVKPFLNRREYEIELTWACAEVRFDSRGRIYWKTFTLGRELARCLAEAQNWRCCYCGTETCDLILGPDRVTLEHVIPKSLDGPDHPDNMVMACFACNMARGNSMCF